MEERLKSLEGISYSEWRQLKFIIDNKFAEIKEKNTFIATEDVLQQVKRITY